MNYLKNHCWCSDSNWGGNYDCSIIVDLLSYEENYKEDWNNLIIRKSFKGPSDLFPSIEIDKIYVELKPEILLWLESSILDFQGNKGWCVGSPQYNSTSTISYSVFFQRRRDALKFIKTWSKWKKPLSYTQSFTCIRKTLNIVTGKYEQN